ncbi:MAG: hypothetical protein AABY52_05860 [Deltaproteobacteria bacterium]
MIENIIMEMAIENNKKVRSAAERHFLAQPIVYKFGIWGIGYLPTWLSYWFARRIADISYLFYKRARQHVKKNLKRVFPETGENEITSLALNTFRNYSTYLVDYGRFRSIDKDSLLEAIKRFDGMENLNTAIGRGKGVVLLTGHLGNWELGAVFVGKHNIKINVVTFRDGIETIDDIRERYRKQHNVNTVILGDSPFATLELANALQKNEVVAMLVDRNSIGSGNSVMVNFFGKTAHFPGGPFALARMTGASILPAFVVKDGNGYRVIVEKPVIIENGEENTEQYAQDIITLFENRIREYPDQWYNFVEI